MGKRVEGRKWILYMALYTERDIAAELCSKTAVHNAIAKFNADGTFYERKRYVRPWKTIGAAPWSSGSVLDQRSLPPVFETRRGHIWRLFHHRLHFITFGGRSAHLPYHVHKNGRKTSIIIIHGRLGPEKTTQ